MLFIIYANIAKLRKHLAEKLVRDNQLCNRRNVNTIASDIYLLIHLLVTLSSDITENIYF